jgi:hypothetical protein
LKEKKNCQQVDEVLPLFLVPFGCTYFGNLKETSEKKPPSKPISHCFTFSQTDGYARLERNNRKIGKFVGSLLCEKT